MIPFKWKCPDCGHVNESDADYAEDYTLNCGNCKGEFEVICDISVEVVEINKVE